MIDPILSLSFSMHSNKGVYALLLGSGISRAAGIPTGWEVTLDLIRKLAYMKGENCEPDPARWYEETFSEEADYSKLLNLVARTSSERNRLLKRYFEPTGEEREQNIKTPTEAHRSIANLVAKGYIKVIVTTNFDRLMERALEEVGVVPVVISTPDSVNGAPPIVHSSCTLIKVHGDYLDTRIKNTPEELSSYDRKLNSLLDRIFDEFGLLICGWSGDWDVALCNAIQRCKTRRFTTYWTVKDNLSDRAQKLADFRSAEIIPIQSADSFFTEFSEKLLAISEFARPHPLSAQAAVVIFKRYLEDERYRIRLHDLVMQETERLFEGISPKVYSTQQPRPDKDELFRRLKQYEAKAEILQSMMMTGGYWGKQDVADLFVKSLERFADHQKERSGYTAWNNLQLYPALIGLFSAGLTALAAGNYDLLITILTKPINKYGRDNGKEPLILRLYPQGVIEPEIGRLLPGKERHHTPTSDYLVELLGPQLKEYIPDQLEFEDKFDRLEYLISLTVMDYFTKNLTHSWAPIGRFGWRGRDYAKNISRQVTGELESEGENWLPLKSGFLGGSLERAKDANKAMLEMLNRVHWW